MATTLKRRTFSTSPSDPAACCPPEHPAALLAGLASPVADPAADEELATFAKALGHPVRVRILRMLAGKDARMCSHADLVRANDTGPRIGYCIVPSALNRLKALLKAL
jgi:ArsR family transcriptional regulator